jgi:peptidoglycan-associated lipoprotein
MQATSFSHTMASIIGPKARLLIAACAVSALVACGSNVKLNDVPVEDKQGTAVTAQLPASASSGADGAQVAQTTVTPASVDPAQASAAGPVNVGKIIYFDYDSFAIKPEFQTVLAAHAKFLATNKVRKIAIEGHTDDRGGREYNLALGQKRSEAVRKALNLLGVTDSQLEAVSFGEEKPASPGADEASWAQNRRAELFYR